MKPSLRTSFMMLTVAATCVATPAFAQEPTAENTRAACSDHRDNDGDGHVDCDDQDCQDLVMCASAVPRAGSAPVDDNARLRGRGVTQLVVGVVLLSLGVVVGGTSAALWILGGDAEYGGMAMDVLGAGMIATGTALLAIGSGKLAETRRARVAVGPTSLAVHF